MSTTLEIKSAVDAADAVRKMLHSFIYEVKIFGDNSSVMEDFDGYEAVIIWEEGPHEWTFDDSTRVSIGNVLSGTKYWFSPISHYSIGIYRDAAVDDSDTYRGTCEDAPCCGCCGRSLYGSEVPDRSSCYDEDYYGEAYDYGERY